MAKNELAVLNDFAIVSGYEGMSEEEIADLQDEMEDLDDERGIACRQVKVPSGGGKAFEVEGDDPEDPELMKEIRCVIVFTHRMNSYWPGNFEDNPDNRIPTCSSMDAKTGVNYETGEIRNCDTCPLNQYADDGSGKPCKNIRRVYFLMPGRPQIYLLSIPPTSIRDVNKQLARIMGSNKIPYTRLVVNFKLDAATNRNGVKYSKVVVERVGLLAPEQAKIVADMRRQLKEQYKNVAITSADYNAEEQPQAAPKTDADGFMEVPEGSPDDGLPFN